jgi:4-alpha-glucanotransferase
MIRACCNSVANVAVFPLQDVLGLDGTHRMNVPGTLGPHNWTWRFDWSWIGTEPTRVLALITAASGRAPIGLVRLPD